MSKTSIIIPNYNGSSVLKECIASIRRHTASPYEIIVVDNGSSDGSTKLCIAERTRFVSLPHNTGFPAACNWGLRMAAGDTLMLLNNDTIVTAGWLDNMLRCLNSREDIGIVGPKTNYASGQQQIIEPFTNIEDMAQRMNKPDSSKWKEVNRLIGFCFLFKRKIVDEVGMLDERFTPGHFEDDDYCYRTRLAGYKLMLAGDIFIYHHGSASFQKEGMDQVQQLLAVNRQQFIDKWGISPDQFM